MGDIQEIARADVARMMIIVQATGNQRLIQLVNNLAEQCTAIVLSILRMPVSIKDWWRSIESYTKVSVRRIKRRLRRRQRPISTIRKRQLSVRYVLTARQQKSKVV